MANEINDMPYTLGVAAAVADRLSKINYPHIALLTALVHQIRADKGAAAVVPYFDPEDGGIDAKVLFLLEAPGPKARDFISLNNPDPTAKNFFQLHNEAGIERKRSVIWNVVPWYIGNDDRTKLRAAHKRDIEAGVPYFKRLLLLLPNLTVIALVGKKAQQAEQVVHMAAPHLQIMKMRHPSGQSLNSKAKRAELLESLKMVAWAID
jgi:uracil-DNA glycosylase